jgi:hypothetical protein
VALDLRENKDGKGKLGGQHAVILTRRVNMLNTKTIVDWLRIAVRRRYLRVPSAPGLRSSTLRLSVRCRDAIAPFARLFQNRWLVQRSELSFLEQALAGDPDIGDLVTPGGIDDLG